MQVSQFSTALPQRMTQTNKIDLSFESFENCLFGTPENSRSVNVVEKWIANLKNKRQKQKSPQNAKNTNKKQIARFNYYESRCPRN